MNNSVNKLNEKIHEARKNKKLAITKHERALSPLTVAMDIVSGAIVGVIIGLFLDKIFDSKPLFLIICIILGVMASFKNIWIKINTKK